MADVYSNFIGGKWIRSQDRRTFESRNPAHPDEVLGIFQRSSSSDVDAAMEAARLARDEWANVPAPERAVVLNRIADLLEKRRVEIARTITREMGKVYSESNGFDNQAAINTARIMAGEGRRLLG